MKPKPVSIIHLRYMSEEYTPLRESVPEDYCKYIICLNELDYQSGKVNVYNN